MNKPMKFRTLIRVQDWIRSIWSLEEDLELKKSLKSIDRAITKALNRLGEMKDPNEWKTDKKKEESANFPQ